MSYLIKLRQREIVDRTNLECELMHRELRKLVNSEPEFDFQHDNLSFDKPNFG